MSTRYQRALCRADISQWLVHLTSGVDADGVFRSPLDVLRIILNSGRIRASKQDHIVKFDPRGATCFYEVPPVLYSQLAETNPNGRKTYGVIVNRSMLWSKGGRPAIYTDSTDPKRWPVEERFRLIWTDLQRIPEPVDWTHEREWRIPGDLYLNDGSNIIWWWPCVSTAVEAQQIFNEFPSLCAIYTIEQGTVVGRGAMHDDNTDEEDIDDFDLLGLRY